LILLILRLSLLNGSAVHGSTLMNSKKAKILKSWLHNPLKSLSAKDENAPLSDFSRDRQRSGLIYDYN
jgi:hypothetical protein